MLLYVSVAKHEHSASYLEKENQSGTPYAVDALHLWYRTQTGKHEPMNHIASTSTPRQYNKQKKPQNCGRDSC
jgi:hypothetical protein